MLTPLPAPSDHSPGAGIELHQPFRKGADKQALSGIGGNGTRRHAKATEIRHLGPARPDRRCEAAPRRRKARRSS